MSRKAFSFIIIFLFAVSGCCPVDPALKDAKKYYQHQKKNIRPTVKATLDYFPSNIEIARQITKDTKSYFRLQRLDARITRKDYESYFMYSFELSKELYRPIGEYLVYQKELKREAWLESWNYARYHSTQLPREVWKGFAGYWRFQDKLRRETRPMARNYILEQAKVARDLYKFIPEYYKLQGRIKREMWRDAENMVTLNIRTIRDLAQDQSAYVTAQKKLFKQPFIMIRDYTKYQAGLASRLYSDSKRYFRSTMPNIRELKKMTFSQIMEEKKAVGDVTDEMRKFFRYQKELYDMKYEDIQAYLSYNTSLVREITRDIFAYGREQKRLFFGFKGEIKMYVAAQVATGQEFIRMPRDYWSGVKNSWRDFRAELIQSLKCPSE